MIKLEEFSGNRDFEIYVSYRQIQNLLTLEFQLKGALKEIYPNPLPEEGVPRAGEELWKKTCFECFFFNESSPAYTELNFNPTGEYALLSFSDYRVRAVMPDSFRVTSIRHQEHSQDLNAIVSVSLPRSSSFICAPTVILMPTTSSPRYFALHHGAKPDFHARDPILAKGFPIMS